MDFFRNSKKDFFLTILIFLLKGCEKILEGRKFVDAEQVGCKRELNCSNLQQSAVSFTSFQKY